MSDIEGLSSLPNLAQLAAARIAPTRETRWTSCSRAREGRCAAIEVKATATPRMADYDGLDRLAKALGDRFARGVMLYLGTKVLPFGERLHALPLQALWQCPAP